MIGCQHGSNACGSIEFSFLLQVDSYHLVRVTLVILLANESTGH